MNKVSLPAWKSYLYNLVKRYRRFLWINKGMIEFGMTNKEKGLLHGMVHKYLRKEVQREVIAIQYHDLVNIVLGSKMSIATKKEIQLANKLIIAHQIKTRSLIMEMKQLKAFAKEVGLKLADIKKLDEDELVIEIIKNLDADATYSDEFIAWYDELPEELFDSADAIDEKEKGGGGEVDYSELIEAIEESDDVDELKELIEDDDFAELFADVDVKKNKTVKKLQKAMLQAIEDAQEAEEEETEEEETEETENDYSEVIEAIQEAEETSELKDIADEIKEDDPELFKGITFRTGRGKAPYRELDEVKAEMLERCGVEMEESEEEEEESDIEITAELVNDAVEAEDKEALVEMCDALEIELKPLEKRSIKKMAAKLMDALPEPAKKSDKKETGKGKSKKKEKQVEETKEETEEKCSVFQVIEEMVIDGAKEKDIIKAVTPVLEERGKKKLFIAKFVKQMIAVVESVQ